MDAFDVNAQAAQQTVIVENYCGTHNPAVGAEYAVELLPDYRPELPTYLQSFTVGPGKTVFRTK